MKIFWYFDFISPFAYLQQECFHKLPQDAEICYKPVLFAGLLSHWGHKGPAEIPQKRIFTYRYVQWLSRRLQIPLKFPSCHPFFPLKALRLAIALGSDADAVRSIFRFIWREGNAPEEEGWQQLKELLCAEADEMISAPDVKQKLIDNGTEATAAGVFGVPTFVVDGNLFWGFDATDMLVDYLEDTKLFAELEMQRIGDIPVSNNVRRR